MERIKNKIIAEKVLEFVTNFDLAIDVGSHEGEWIYLLRDKFKSIHSFEPEKNLYKNLVNKFINDPNVFIYNTAIMNGNFEGSISTGKSWAGFVMPKTDGDILVKTLDTYKFEKCGLLKIDVEGAEFLALLGAKKLIKRTSPVIVVECKKKTAERYGWDKRDLEKWLRDKNYELKFQAYPNLVWQRN